MKFTPKQGLLTATALLVSASLWSSPAAAQTRSGTFPEKGKTIQIIVGFAAGGSTDVGARLLAKGLEKELGVPVVVVNRPGAGGQLGYVSEGAPIAVPADLQISAYLSPPGTGGQIRMGSGHQARCGAGGRCNPGARL